MSRFRDKTWRLPQLSILTRRPSEEFVLSMCKSFTYGGGPGVKFAGCTHIPEVACTVCSMHGQS